MTQSRASPMLKHWAILTFSFREKGKGMGADWQKEMYSDSPRVPMLKHWAILALELRHDLDAVIFVHRVG